MIKGIGVDIADIGRMGKLIEKYGQNFLCKVFTENEINWCNQKAFPEIHFSGRWAAKEAFYKALPENCQQYSSWKSIEILPSVDSGKPKVIVRSDLLQELLEKEGIKNVFLSISHEKKNCIAMIVME